MMDKITDEKLDRYFDLTERALKKAKYSKNASKLSEKTRIDFIDMIERYVSDAKHFRKNKDYVNSFAAISYAHGWLDAGARIGLFDVHDSELFTVD